MKQHCKSSKILEQKYIYFRNLTNEFKVEKKALLQLQVNNAMNKNLFMFEEELMTK